MESFNFGAFDPTIGARIAAIPQEAQKQRTANMLQAMQMQGAMRQNEMSQMQLDELKSDRAEMIKLQQELEANGGSPDLGRLANRLLKSPKHFKLGIELSQKLSAQARFDKLNFGDAPPPTPTEAPANRLPGVVSPPAGITNPPAAPQAQTTIANLNRQIAANMALGTEQGYKYAEMLQKRADALSKVYTVGTTLMGPEGQIIGTAPEATSQEIRTLQALGYPNTPAGYAAFRDAQRPDKIPAPPSMVAEYTFAKTPDGGGFRGSFQDFVMARAAAARTPGATVVMPPLEKTEQQEKGKLNVKIYGDIAATADRARKILPSLETSEAILTGGFKTGFGSDVQTQAARVLSVLGVPEADKYATNSQLFLAQGRQALLQRQLEQKGAQSEGDAQRINQTFIQLGNTPEANKFLAATAKAQSKQDIARQKFYSDWWSKSKTYEGAEEAWLDGAGGKSLFDSPDMKQFAPKTQPSDISSAAAAEIARRKEAQR